MNTSSDSTTNMTVGTKGADVYTVEGVGSALVSLNTLLVRGVSEETIVSGMTSATKEEYEDLWVLLFQNRDIRGGKGERKSTEMMWTFMLKNHEEDAFKMLSLVPQYGCWRDLFVLADLFPTNIRLTGIVIQMAVAQLNKDKLALSEGKSISLLAKWIPRETRLAHLAKKIASVLFPDAIHISERMKKYRQKISELNRHINTTEIDMCGKTWSDILPAKVPGRCLAKNTKAFINESSKKISRSGETGRIDRVECREHFLQFFKDAKEGKTTAKAANVVYPHELVKESFNAHIHLSKGEKGRIEAQWSALVKDAKEQGGLGRSLALCDFSGSMAVGNGVPYMVSIAMGLLISELTTDEFKNSFLTFASKPTLHKMNPQDSFIERVNAIHNAHIGQGTSTDFQKALDLVLSQLKSSRCRPGQEPENLIVITDMNFDQACSSSQQSNYTGNSYRHVVKTQGWQTHLEMAREAFKRAGEDMWGMPFVPPRIVLWNVAATSSDFHATENTEGVVMLSGWSPSLFKNLLKGDIRSMTPMEMMRIILDDERYQSVRDTLRF